MEGLGSFLLFAVFFYIMMRFGCGAHRVHGGHGEKDADHDHIKVKGDKAQKIDPVCGMTVRSESGYGKMHEGHLYRFCSKKCLDRFDADPAPYLKPVKGERP